jgi:nicotinate dehydrogenase subunit A
MNDAPRLEGDAGREEFTASSVSFHVNGEARRIEVAGTTALLYVLRNDLGLKSVRFGCGAGDCGACMVLVDDRPTNACNIAVESVDGKRITTVEALGESAEGRALLAAFARLQALQCGFCVSGVLISALALLRAKPDARDEDVRLVLDRHFCRCGAHQRILGAVSEASEALRHG